MYGMSKHSEPQSLQVEVLRGFAKNYRSFLGRGKKQNAKGGPILNKTYLEEAMSLTKHPNKADNAGFS